METRTVDACIFQTLIPGARGGVVGWGTMLQDEGRVYEVIGFFNWTNPFSRTMALGSTQPLTEISTKNLPGGKGRTARRADDHTAICEPIFYKIWACPL
jgi:hypothetical protein